jgi:hypothetical protein
MLGLPSRANRCTAYVRYWRGARLRTLSQHGGCCPITITTRAEQGSPLGLGGRRRRWPRRQAPLSRNPRLRSRVFLRDGIGHGRASTGRKTSFSLAELAARYDVSKDVGVQIMSASPNGAARRSTRRAERPRPTAPVVSRKARQYWCASRA